MKKKVVSSIFILIAAGSYLCFANSQEQATQVSQITGVPANRVAKMAEAMDKMQLARKYARDRRFDESMQLLTEITKTNNFDYEDERSARLTMAGIRVLAGNYAQAYETIRALDDEQRLLSDYVDFIKAMADFSANKDPKVLLDCVSLYNSRNKNIIPPKVYDLNYLGRMVRLYEMAGEIDQALALVEQYYQLYFPNGKPLKKKLSGIGLRRREGITLLKEALLRDKQEGKNIYAQELINTTDYFGFV